MTASLYQRESVIGPTASSLEEVVEIPLGADSPTDTENVRGRVRGVKRNEVARTLPEIARAGEEVVHLIRLLGAYAQVGEFQGQPPRVRVMGIQVHDHQHRVGAVLAALAVGNEGVVVDRVKLQAPVALQRRVAAPDEIQARDEVPEAVRAVEVP